MGDGPLKKKQKTGEFGEEDVCNLFQRYTAAQVLALLREVAQSPGVKIDWNDLVKNTATGITSARECQILWRHLAYRHPLPDKMEEQGDQPLDDDSDLEYELEPSPPVSTELAMEAANCVKRWAIIRKKQGSSSAVGATSQLSEVQLATRRAIDMALKDSITGGGSIVGSGAAASNNHGNLNSSNGDAHAENNAVSSQPLNTQSTTSASTKPTPLSMAKPQPQPTLKKVPAKPNVSDSIQAAAVAAGARIASPSDAATLFKAAQSKNAVHIMGASSSLVKSSTMGNSPLPPNVRFIRTGLVGNAPTSMAAGGHQTKGSTQKPTVTNVPVSLLSKAKSGPSSSASEPQQKENKTSANEVKVPVLDVKPGSETQENIPSSLPKCSPKEPKTGLDDGKQTVENSASSLPKCSPKGPNKGQDDGKQTVDAGSSQCATSGDVNKTEGIKEENNADGEKPPVVVQVTSNPTPSGSTKDSPNSAINADGAEKPEASSEADKSAPIGQ